MTRVLVIDDDTDSIDPVNQFRKLLEKGWEKVPPEQLLMSYRLTKELEKRLGRILNEQKLPCEKPVTLKDMEERAIVNALAFYDYNVSLVARALGIGRTTLYRKMKEYGIANLSHEYATKLIKDGQRIRVSQIT